jgi:tripartite-type tricarboxylate transporter receptor subunit TctC
VISSSRSSILRDVPTLREALGVELDGFATWYGFFAPPQTPPDVIDRLEAGILQVMQDPGVTAKMSQLGYEILLTGSSEFGRENLAEIERLRRFAKGD